MKLKNPVAEPKKEEGQVEEGEAVEEGVEENADPKAGEQAEKLARLEKENADLKADKAKQDEERRAKPVAAAPKVTASYLRTMSDKQREYGEQQTGMGFDDVIKNVEAQEAQDSRSQTLAVQARGSLRDAIDDEVDRNPQVAKLKGHIRDYFEDVSDADKADSATMARHMKKALVYAKGAAGVPEVRHKQSNEARTSGPDDNDEPTFADPKSGDIKAGTYRLNDGFKLEIQDLIPKEKRAKMVHPEHPTGIKIASDFDEAPRFR